MIVICVSSSECVATCTAPVCVKKVAVHWEKKKTSLFNIFDLSHEEKDASYVFPS